MHIWDLKMAGKISSKMLLYAIFVIVAIFLPLVSGDLIGRTCKKTTNSQLCEFILRGDPKSPGADVAGLGLIMVNSLESMSITALLVINQFMKSKPKLKESLTECRIDYKVVLKYDIKVAVDAITSGNPKSGVYSMAHAALMAQGCEDAFKPSPSPFKNVNKVAHDMAAVAAAIIKLLL